MRLYPCSIFRNFLARSALRCAFLNAGMRFDGFFLKAEKAKKVLNFMFQNPKIYMENYRKGKADFYGTENAGT